MLSEALLLLVGVVLLLYVYGTRTYTYWSRKGVPHDPPKPFFGSYLPMVLMRRTMLQLNQDLYDKGHGQAFTAFYRFRSPTLMLRDPELIKHVMVRDFTHFHDNSFHANEKLDPLFSRNPFMLKGDRWKAVRSLLTPAFSIAKIKPQYPLMVAVCEDLVRYLREEATKRLPDGLEAKELAAKFTTEVVASCAFGIRGGCFEDEAAPLRVMGRRVLHPGWWKNILINIAFFLPALRNLLGIRFLDLEVDKFFRRIIGEVVSHREANNITRKDYLQMLIDLKSKGQIEGEQRMLRSAGQDIEYTDVDITAHALTFFTDGFETSSISLSFALYELAMNPGVQDRVRAEVDAVIDKYKGDICYEATQEMVYLDMVLSESQRMHSPAQFTDRVCTKPWPLQLPSGRTCTLDVGTIVVIPITPLHFDPEHFPDPMKFDPERFAEGRRQGVGRYCYLPFGEGPRQCLGMRFALAQIKVGLAAMVRHFVIVPTPRTPRTIEQDPDYFMTAAKGGLWLHFQPRPDLE